MPADNNEGDAEEMTMTVCEPDSIINERDNDFFDKQHA